MQMKIQFNWQHIRRVKICQKTNWKKWLSGGPPQRRRWTLQAFPPHILYLIYFPFALPENTINLIGNAVSLSPVPAFVFKIHFYGVVFNVYDARSDAASSMELEHIILWFFESHGSVFRFPLKLIPKIPFFNSFNVQRPLIEHRCSMPQQMIPFTSILKYSTSPLLDGVRRTVTLNAAIHFATELS